MAEDTATVKGAAKLSRRIRTLRQKYSLPPLINEIGALLYRRTMERFAREITPDYAPWADLKPATLRRKAAQGYGDKQKLERTSAMRKAIQLIRGRADGGTFANTGASARIGIVDPEIAEYARIQNVGDRSGRIVSRRFLGIGALDVKAVDSFLRRRAKQIERTL